MKYVSYSYQPKSIFLLIHNYKCFVYAIISINRLFYTCIMKRKKKEREGEKMERKGNGKTNG